MQQHPLNRAKNIQAPKNSSKQLWIHNQIVLGNSSQKETHRALSHLFLTRLATTAGTVMAYYSCWGANAAELFCTAPRLSADGSCSCPVAAIERADHARTRIEEPRRPPSID